MKKETLINENEIDKAIRLQSAILKRLDDLTLEEMDSIVNTIHLYNFDKFNILIRIIDDLDVKSVANSVHEDIYSTDSRSGIKHKIITMFPCLRIEFEENMIRKKVVTHHNNVNIVDSNYNDYQCKVLIKEGWNIYFKKIESDVEIYDMNGDRLPPTVKDVKIHIMCYYSKANKELILH